MLFHAAKRPGKRYRGVHGEKSDGDHGEVARDGEKQEFGTWRNPEAGRPKEKIEGGKPRLNTTRGRQTG